MDSTYRSNQTIFLSVDPIFYISKTFGKFNYKNLISISKNL